MRPTCSSNESGTPTGASNVTSPVACASARAIRRSISRRLSRYSDTRARSRAPSAPFSRLASSEIESRRLRSSRMRAARCAALAPPSNNPDEAVRLYKQVLEKDPTDFEPLNALKDVLVGQGKKAEALAALKAARAAKADSKIDLLIQQLEGASAEAVADEAGGPELVRHERLADAVADAVSAAKPGESVLLSPACPGFFSRHYLEDGVESGGFKSILRDLTAAGE